MSVLQLRLKNCIQTILELEPSLCTTGTLGSHFADELHVLKGYLEQIDSMALMEEDVQHLEAVTAAFLAELKFIDISQPNRVLQ